MNETAAPRNAHHIWVWLTALLALLFNLAPWPGEIKSFVPQMAFLVLAFWVIEQRQTSYFLLAFVMGLLLDVYANQLLGVSSLIYAIGLYWVHGQRLNLRSQTLLYQAAFILLVSAAMQLLTFIFIGQPPSADPWPFWLSPLVAAFLWPPLSVLLNQLALAVKP